MIATPRRRWARALGTLAALLLLFSVIACRIATIASTSMRGLAVTSTSLPPPRGTAPPGSVPNQPPPMATAPPTPSFEHSPIDQMLLQCPTTQEVDAINSDFKLSFEADPTGGKLVCTRAAGSADLTLLQRRVYQTLHVMKHLQFSKPLPWTDKPLYDWVVATIKGLRFRSDIGASYCCDPKDMINVRIASNTLLVMTDRWVDPPIGGGMMDAVVLFAHEARHNQGYPHTCGTKDKTIAELGAWGVQYYLLNWLADYSDPTFITMPSERVTARQDAEDIRKTRFCNEPQ